MGLPRETQRGRQHRTRPDSSQRGTRKSNASISSTLLSRRKTCLLLDRICARNTPSLDIEPFNFNSTHLNRQLDDERRNARTPRLRDSTRRHLGQSLFGLKQAGRKWCDALCRTLADLGFRASTTDPGIFIPHIGEHYVILATHIDDCALTESLCEIIDDTSRSSSSTRSPS